MTLCYPTNSASLQKYTISEYYFFCGDSWVLGNKEDCIIGIFRVDYSTVSYWLHIYPLWISFLTVLEWKIKFWFFWWVLRYAIMWAKRKELKGLVNTKFIEQINIIRFLWMPYTIVSQWFWLTSHCEACIWPLEASLKSIKSH